MRSTSVTPLLLVALCSCRTETTVTPTPVDAVDPASVDRQALTNEVMAVMDEQADPCDDFYAYACGEWLDTTEIPEDQSRFGRFHVLREQNLATQKDILASLPLGSGGDEQAKLARFWNACMDEGAIEAAGTEPLVEPLSRIAAVEDKTSLLEMAGFFHARGIDMLLSTGVTADYKDPDLNVLHLSQGGLGLPDRDYYLREDPEADKLRELYAEHVATMLRLAGDDNPAPDAAAVLAFETELAKVSTPRDQLRDPDKRYNRMTRAELDKLTPALSWKGFFDGLGTPDVSHLNVSPTEYFKGVDAVVAKTDLETMKAYMRWHVVNAAAAHLPRAFVEANFAFYGQALNGQQALAQRWKRCVQMADGALGDALGKLFVERVFGGDSKTIASSMIKQVEDAFAAGLPSLSWMDDATRKRALDKMHAVVNKIGYPDEWKKYDAVQIGAEHFANIAAASEHEIRRQLDEIGKPVDPAEWHMTPATVNAYYNPSNNEMVFPAGILQRPFFDAAYPMPMNFGGIGMVMGHELTHGFDDQGRKYDGEGRLVQWWDDEVVGAFEGRAECVENLYSSYEVQPGVHLNGKLTLGENIADLGGIKESFRAYQMWAETNPAQQTAVEGLTDEQLFFVSFGQIWCTKATQEAERVLALTDPHSHPRYRVNGPLSNMPEFWETFSCNQGTPMHPTNVCEVW